MRRQCRRRAGQVRRRGVCLGAAFGSVWGAGKVGRGCYAVATNPKNRDRENCSAGTPHPRERHRSTAKRHSEDQTQYIMAEDGSAAKKPKIKCSARQNIPKYGFKPAATMIAH